MPMGLGSYASRVVATAVVATDGTGDFTDIQKAIDSLPAIGGVVYIKEGNYTLTAGLVLGGNNIALIGAGKSTKIILNANGYVIYATGRSGLMLDNLYLYGQGSYGSSNNGVAFVACSDCFITDSWIEQCGYAGIYLSTSAAGIHVNNCVINNCYFAGIIMDGGAGGGISGNTIHTNTGEGIIINAHTDSMITGNRIYSNTEWGIYCFTGSHRNVISNNVIKDNGTGGVNSGIYITGDSDSNIISDNICTGNTARGVRITGATVNDTILVSNNLKGNTLGEYSDTGTGTEIAHNILDSVVDVNSRVRAYRSGVQGINASTVTKVQLNAETYDNLGEFDPSSFHRFTAQNAGYYSVTAQVWLLSMDADSDAEVRIRVNGSTVAISRTFSPVVGSIAVKISDIIHLNATDYVELFIEQFSAAGKNINGTSTLTYMSLHRLS